MRPAPPRYREAEIDRRPAEPIPATMHAAAIDRTGGPETLTIQELPVPGIDPGEVLIALRTSGVGSWDAAIRGGWFPEGSPRFPLVLGTDGAGIVAAIGSRVRRFSIGERVYAYSFLNPKGGFYAEFVAVAAEKVGHVPDPLDLEQAGAIPTTGLTALQGIEDWLRLKRGESVIIHGASGGVGSLAVQFAKWRGAGVIATARGDDGLEFVRELGADVEVDGGRDDLTDEVRRIVPDGVDAVLGLAGGESLERCIDAVRPGGRVAYPNGVEPEPKPRRGITVRSYDAVAGVRPFERLARAVEGSHLQVPIAAAYDLDEAAEAHRRIEAGHVLGKVILHIG